MVEFFLILSMYSNAAAGSTATSVSALPIPFYSLEECSAAGEKAKAGLLEGMSMSKNVSFVCVKRTKVESATHNKNEEVK
jgi:hypothetical protein